jgi:hypothetical protein
MPKQEDNMENLVKKVADGIMEEIAEKAKARKERLRALKADGPSCSVPGLMHPILGTTGDVGGHSIGSVCPSCGISLSSHGEAVPKEP